MSDAAAMLGKVSVGAMIARVKLMFSSPAAYWEEMAGDQGGVKAMLPSVITFVGISAGAQFIGVILTALRMGMARFIHWFIIGGLVQLVLGIGLGILSFYLLSVIVNAFGKTFNASNASSDNATKVAFGSLVPLWLGQMLSITSIGIVGMLAGLGGFGYGCYLMYLGLQRIMGAPQDKSVGYTAAVMAIFFVIMAVIAGVLAGVTGCVTGCAVTSALRG